MEREFARRTGRESMLTEIAASDGAEERALIDRLADRLARAMATLVVASLAHIDVAAVQSSITDLPALARSAAPAERLAGISGIMGSLPEVTAFMPSARATPACCCALIKDWACAVQKSVTAFE